MDESETNKENKDYTNLTTEIKNIESVQDKYIYGRRTSYLRRRYQPGVREVREVRKEKIDIDLKRSRLPDEK